jgi:diguanylate cyclase (GGDEF)-like protein/PAS domain S-box-containing protein
VVQQVNTLIDENGDTGLPPGRSLGRILVVDDERLNRQMLGRILSRHGYAIVEATCGEEALETIDRVPVDLVLLDLVMPGMGGFECLRRIRKRFSVSDLPVIIVTADQNRQKIIEAFRDGANDYVTKPVDRDVTLARIATHTRLRASLLALRNSEERYALAAQGTNDGLWDWNVTTGEVYYSPRWKSMLGYQDQEIGSSPDEWTQRIHEHDADRFRSAMLEGDHAPDNNLNCELRMVHRDGSYRWMICRGVRVRNASGHVHRMAGSLTDITEGKVGDALTGLPNRILFHDRLQRTVDRWNRDRRNSFAVMFLDLDNFKLINDSLGHQAGDKLLIVIAERLTNCLRGTDILSRCGLEHLVARHAGDEFTILLEDIASPDDVCRVADRILERISAPVRIEGHEITPSMSIGWTDSSQFSGEVDDFLREADTAMYHAKSAGRNRACRFEPSMRHKASRRLELEGELRHAIASQEFFLHYQPFVNMSTGVINGFETLVRWRHPSRGTVFPGEFISICEETGLIVPLGWQVTRMACSQAAVWQASFPNRNTSVSINVSMKQLAQKDFYEQLIGCIAETGVFTSQVCIEVTESMLMESAEQICPVLQRIRELGIRIAVDDFGTGYSSLACLHRFPLDILKIDRSFVDEIATSRENRQIARTIVDLGRNLAMRVVAEGVENHIQREILIEIGCDVGQGYLWSAPVAHEAATSQLQSRIPEIQISAFPLPVPSGLNPDMTPAS